MRTIDLRDVWYEVNRYLKEHFNSDKYRVKEVKWFGGYMYILKKGRKSIDDLVWIGYDPYTSKSIVYIKPRCQLGIGLKSVDVEKFIKNNKGLKDNIDLVVYE